MKFLFLTALVAVILTMTLCSMRLKQRPTDYLKTINQIKANVAEKISKKHNADWVGDGGQRIGCACKIFLAFQIRRPLNRDESRRILIDASEELLKTVNENTILRPYLRDFPFTTKNIEVVVFSSDSDGTKVYDPFITASSVFESDEIVFLTADPQQTYGYKNEYMEDYQEALEIVKQQQGVMGTTPQRCQK
jgi:hypothetical protein